MDITDIITPYTKKVIKGEGLNPEGDLIINFIIIFPNRMGQDRRTYIGKLLNYTIPKLNIENNNYTIENYKEISKKNITNENTSMDSTDNMDPMKHIDPMNPMDPMDHGVECHQQ